MTVLKPKNMTMSFSVSPQLYAQVSEYLRGKDKFAGLRLTEKAYINGESLRQIVKEFLSYPSPANPITREVLIKARDAVPPFARNRQLQFNLSVHALLSPHSFTTILEKLDQRAEDENVTRSAILRRAMYEITRPENPDPLATYDGWGDANKS